MTRESQNGFSLIELVITVAILTVVMGAAFQLMSKSQSSFDANQLLAEAHQNADFAVGRVTEIIRGAGSNPTNVTTVNWDDFLNYPDSSDHTRVRITSDLNGDGDFLDDISNTPDAQYFTVAAEDIIVQYDSDAQTIQLVDNRAGADATPVKIAEHIISFDVDLFRDIDGTPNNKEARVTVEAGPSRAVGQSDPRFRTFVTQSEIRLRNR